MARFLFCFCFPGSSKELLIVIAANEKIWPVAILVTLLQFASARLPELLLRTCAMGVALRADGFYCPPLVPSAERPEMCFAFVFRSAWAQVLAQLWLEVGPHICPPTGAGPS